MLREREKTNNQDITWTPDLGVYGSDTCQVQACGAGVANVPSGYKDWEDISEGPAENLAHTALKESLGENNLENCLGKTTQFGETTQGCSLPSTKTGGHCC